MTTPSKNESEFYKNVMGHYENEPRFRESVYCKLDFISVSKGGKRVSAYFNTRSYVDKEGNWNNGHYRIGLSSLEKRIKTIEKNGGVADESIKALKAAQEKQREVLEQLANKNDHGGGPG